MTAYLKAYMYSALELVGFIPVSDRSDLFITTADGSISPAFYCGIQRKGGKARYSGGIGLYFKEFEEEWRNHLSTEERKLDATLPIIMHIANFEFLIDKRFFWYSDDFDDILSKARYIYQVCSALPSSIDELASDLKAEKLAGKPVSRYLHIAGHLEDDELYLRKSADFISWFSDQWPDMASSLRACLTAAQQSRLGLGD